MRLTYRIVTIIVLFLLGLSVMTPALAATDVAPEAATAVVMQAEGEEGDRSGAGAAIAMGVIGIAIVVVLIVVVIGAAAMGIIGVGAASIRDDEG